MIHNIKRVSNRLKKETVLVISALAAMISMVFVPFDKKYMEYIDVRVLGVLFCLMAVIGGFESVGLFERLSSQLLRGVKGLRKLIFLLVFTCFISSMWITNDVSLIAFVPFTILVLTKLKNEKYLIFVIVMQTIAANLGSMLTPVGNPQNLYLYTYYKLNAITFYKITCPVVILSFVLLSIVLLFVKNEEIKVELEDQGTISNRTNLFLYVALFLLCLATVFHIVNYVVTLIVTILVLLVINKSIFKKLDYSLLANFVCFFIFVGNIGRIEVVHQSIVKLIKGRVFLSSIFVSQGISNVPAAVLLSTFTKDYKSLILGVNIGGLGTLIASLASLISFRLYLKTKDAKGVLYLVQFTLYNLLFLGLLILCSYLL